MEPGAEQRDDQAGHLATLVRTRRKSLALTQKQLAHRVGVDVGTVKGWERGAWGISPRNLGAVAEVLQVETRDLIAPADGALPDPLHPDDQVRAIAWTVTRLEAKLNALLEHFDVDPATVVPDDLRGELLDALHASRGPYPDEAATEDPDGEEDARAPRAPGADGQRVPAAAERRTGRAPRAGT